ncbi:unnamed protein product [Brugia pahangi]|uniref:DNA-binding protein n=1 Tax=Brugia pahangi TaxID=6280 RepID=A0A0N4THV9_BRUPA|nr:unnamed protein product [Brugia pahangi]
MTEKEKFSKEFDENIKKLMQGEYVPFLSKLFKLAYETPYANKVDYGSVQLILNQMSSTSKNLNSRSRGKGNSKTSLTGKAVSARNISPSTVRKREGNTKDLGMVLKIKKF